MFAIPKGSAMAVGDKFVVTLTAYYNDDLAQANPIINVFAYEGVNGAPNAASLDTGFSGSIIPALGVIQTTNLTYNLLEVINLDNPSDFSLSALSDVGTRAGQYLNPFVGWEFQFIRAVRGIHHGRKTIAGIAETDINNGAADSGINAALLAAAAAMESTILQGGNEYTPKIWRRAGNYAPYSGTPPVGTPYPDTFYPISGVVYNRVSTQNSRKR